MKTLKQVIDESHYLNPCCGGYNERLILIGFKAAMELAHDTEGELMFTCTISNALQRELNRYHASEKLLREQAMEKIGL